jgi:hypothetical protein
VRRWACCCCVNFDCFWRFCTGHHFRYILRSKPAHADVPSHSYSEKCLHLRPVLTDGWTALHFVAREGHTAVATPLISAGASLSAATEDGWTSLMLASIEGHADIVDALIAVGAPVHATDRYGESAISCASLAVSGRKLSPSLDCIRTGAPPFTVSPPLTSFSLAQSCEQRRAF